MTRRKGERTARMNERDFPHIVELPLPDGGWGSKVDSFEAFHRERGLESHRGRRQRRNEQEFVRWCFADADVALEFAKYFGGSVVGKAEPVHIRKRERRPFNQ